MFEYSAVILFKSPAFFEVIWFCGTRYAFTGAKNRTNWCFSVIWARRSFFLYYHHRLGSQHVFEECRFAIKVVSYGTLRYFLFRAQGWLLSFLRSLSMQLCIPKTSMLTWGNSSAHSSYDKMNVEATNRRTQINPENVIVCHCHHNGLIRWPTVTMVTYLQDTCKCSF